MDIFRSSLFSIFSFKNCKKLTLSVKMTNMLSIFISLKIFFDILAVYAFTGINRLKFLAKAYLKNFQYLHFDAKLCFTLLSLRSTIFLQNSLRQRIGLLSAQVKTEYFQWLSILLSLSKLRSKLTICKFEFAIFFESYFPFRIGVFRRFTINKSKFLRRLFKLKYRK